jgi:hypothetical protein
MVPRVVLIRLLARAPRYECGLSFGQSPPRMKSPLCPSRYSSVFGRRLGSALFLAGSLLVCQAQVPLVSLAGRDVTHLIADPNRPVVYALNRGGAGTNASLLALDAANGLVLREVTLAESPTDLDLSRHEDAMYVIHFGIDQIQRVNLNNFTLDAHRTFSPPGNWVGPAEVWYRIRTGRAGEIYFIDAQWAPVLRALNFNTGQPLGAYDLDGNGVGGVAVSRHGNPLFASAQYGWSAGSLHSWLSRLRLQEGTWTREQDSFGSSRRDPLNAPVLLTAGEETVFNKQYAFDPLDLSAILATYEESIYAISLHGDLAVGHSRVFDGRTGSSLYNLPFPTTIAAFATDQRTLLLVDRPGAQLALVPTSSILEIPGPQLQPTPADHAVVSGNLTRLTWSAHPAALRHEIYLGTQADEIQAAEPHSTSHLGSTEALYWSLPNPLQAGTRYYWRVDTVTALTTQRGAVWQFEVSSIWVEPTHLTLTVIAGSDHPPRDLTVETPAGTAWQPLEDSPWLSLLSAGGVGPGMVRLGFQTAALPLGHHVSSIQIQADGVSIAVPVQIEVLSLNLHQLVADRTRPYLYGLQAPPTGRTGWMLLLVDAENGTVRNLLPIGLNPTDMTVHDAENRLYVTDWGQPVTHVVDLNTWTLLPPLQLGTDVYRINAGRTGRMIIEGLDQWIDASIIDTATGRVVGQLPWPVYQGDGETSPDGQYYYHADFGISNAHIRKFDVIHDNPIEVAASTQEAVGPRHLVLSGDGSRLFWGPHFFNNQLEWLGSLGGGMGAPIRTCTHDGSYAFTASRAYQTDTRTAVFTLPFVTTVQAVSDQAGRFYAFDPARGVLESFPLSVITNRAPGASNQVVTTAEDTPVSFVLSATDPEGDPLTYQLLSLPASGTLSGTPPALVYTPNRDFHGIDQFQYVASDPYRTSAVAVVTLHVTPVNDPPVAFSQTVRVPADGHLEIQLAGHDPDGDELTFAIQHPPTHGTLTGQPPRLDYTPQPGFQGTDEFTFIAHDGQVPSAPAAVTLMVMMPQCTASLPTLIAWWRGEDSAYDAVGGYDVVPTPELTFQPGKVGTAFTATAGTHLIRVPAPSRLDILSHAGGWTLDAWVSPSPGHTRQTLAAWAETGLMPWLEWALVPVDSDPTRYWVEAAWRGNGTQPISFTGSVPVEAGRFQHLALTFHPASATAQLFRNAILIGEMKWNSLAPVAHGDLYLGGLPAPATTAFRGLLDEFAIQDRPLTATELTALVEADRFGRCFQPLPPRVVQGPASVLAEAGATVTLAVEATGTGPLAFQWLHENQPLEGATQRWLVLEPLGASHEGRYQVRVTNTTGSDTSLPATVGVNLLTNGSFESSNFNGWTTQDLTQPLRALTVLPQGVTSNFGFFTTAPTHGNYSATHGWDGSPAGLIRLTRNLNLPTNGAYLAFDYRAAWNLADFGSALYPRVFRVVFEPIEEGPASASYPILQANPSTLVRDTGWRTLALDLASLAGQAVHLAFEWTVPEPLTGPALFELDHVRLVAGSAPEPGIDVTGLAWAQPGSLRIQFQAALGRNYTVLSSTDLKTWAPLGQADHLGAGQFRFLDETAKNAPTRFYRLQTP